MFAQANGTCLECHDADSIDTNVLASSVHDGLDCIDCHADLAGIETIEDGHDDVVPVDCTGCHEDQAKLEAESLHGAALARGDKLAPRCQSCHGSHGILPGPRSPKAWQVQP